MKKYTIVLMLALFISSPVPFKEAAAVPRGATSGKSEKLPRSGHYSHHQSSLSSSEQKSPAEVARGSAKAFPSDSPAYERKRPSPPLHLRELHEPQSTSELATYDISPEDLKIAEKLLSQLQSHAAFERTIPAASLEVLVKRYSWKPLYDDATYRLKKSNISRDEKALVTEAVRAFAAELRDTPLILSQDPASSRMFVKK